VLGLAWPKYPGSCTHSENVFTRKEITEKKQLTAGGAHLEHTKMGGCGGQKTKTPISTPEPLPWGQKKILGKKGDNSLPVENQPGMLMELKSNEYVLSNVDPVALFWCCEGEREKPLNPVKSKGIENRKRRW